MLFMPATIPCSRLSATSWSATPKRGKHFTFELIDPQSRPDLIEKYQITDRGPRIVVTCGLQDSRAKEPTEQELTYALLKVIRQSDQKIFFLVGHGEGDLKSEEAEGYKAIAEAITAEGYAVETLDFTRGASAASTQLQLHPAATAAQRLPKKASKSPKKSASSLFWRPNAPWPPLKQRPLKLF